MEMHTTILKWVRNFKLPSRNQTIFFTGAGTIFGLVYNDRKNVKEIQTQLKQKASSIGTLPSEWNDPSRKVLIMLDSTHWPNYYFNEFAKPILEAGAINYEIVEGKHTADIIKKSRDIIWDAKEFTADQLEGDQLDLQYRNRGWFSFTGGLSKEQLDKLQKKYNDDAMKKFNPLLYQPKYDVNVGLIAVGPRGWRNMLHGLQYGYFTKPTDQREFNETRSDFLEPDLVDLPSIGYISSIDRTGFVRFFSRRILGWFTRSWMAQEIGEQALKIVQNETMPFRNIDLTLGNEWFDETVVNEEAKDVVMQRWNHDADSVVLNPDFAEKLVIIKQ